MNYQNESREKTAYYLWQKAGCPNDPQSAEYFWQQAKNYDFDPHVSPDNPHNKEIAKQKRVEFDHHSQSYLDEDGCQIYDKFGQPY